ncbi:hypothetical protein [Cryobacterium psychrophilum]|uniref:Uncharacterized protein n=1 Tax=Cryobacterium psychrophilum TaxID=41988 RepID=A0A4Y8KNC1_9MICO|nr:hypothetical protein [Cryobacterium psychrophilum]TDW29847.1 hypothetical protein EDD25_1563 [Cryobacterium psychrophilum]TFD76767.1 hypothetical protein E3T53_12915 [Cryobacterium psychrophilum]
MSSRWGRFVRGWITASFAVFVAAFSHVVAGGAAPAPVSISLALAFSGMVCVALAGKTLSLLRSSASVAVSQIALHALFGLGSGATSPILTGSGHHGPVSISPGTAAAVDSMGMSVAGTSGTDAWMWAAHGVAAVLTIVALHRGERAFWFLVDLAASGLAVVLRGTRDLVPVFVHAVPAPLVAADAFVPSPLAVLRSCLTRRGPPVIRIVF